MIAHIRKDTKEEQSVEKHLLGTAEIAEELGKELGIEALSKLTALVHDIGKMRKRFEEYLRASVTESRKTRRGEVNHSSVGASVLDWAQCREVKDKLEKIMDKEKDSIRFYYLGNNYKTKVEHIGAKESFSVEEPLII